MENKGDDKMAHVAKYNKSAVGRMFAHYGRENKNYSNQCIDPEKTYLNYNLASHGMSQIEFFHQRLSEVKVQNRKDVNVMCDWIVTAPKDLPTEDLQHFFTFSFQFLSQRYGKENVISAHVHMDETTPHMHFAFIPVIEDKKKGGYKVSAKEVLNRNDLRSFHKDLQHYLENALGYQINILNGATEQGNKSILKLQNETLSQRLAEKKEEAQQIEKQIQECTKKYEKMTKTLSDKELKEIDVTPKRLIGGFKGLTGQQAQELVNTSKALKKENKNLKNENKKLKEEKSRLISEKNSAVSKLEQITQERQAMFSREKLEQAEREYKQRTRMEQAENERNELIEYMSQLEFADGSTALDKFEELKQEQRLKQKNKGYGR